MGNSRKKNQLFFALACLHLLFVCDASAKVITRLPTDRKVVALTFDACETKTPSYFDETILAFLLKKTLPVTLFVSGKFALRNTERLAEISKLESVEIENHSMNHIQHMEKLNSEEQKAEVLENGKLLQKITGKPTKFFRFPGGNCDDRSVKAVEALGLKVVHWSFASGDPDKKVGPEDLKSWVLSKTRRGGILIFHINGRGYWTGSALPDIVTGLMQKGYTFSNLRSFTFP